MWGGQGEVREAFKFPLGSGILCIYNIYKQYPHCMPTIGW